MTDPTNPALEPDEDDEIPVTSDAEAVDEPEPQDELQIPNQDTDVDPTGPDQTVDPSVANEDPPVRRDAPDERDAGA